MHFTLLVSGVFNDKLDIKMCVSAKKLIFLNIAMLFAFCQGLPRKWPSRFPRCYRDDPNLNKCMLEATKQMKPFLKEGIPELNISPISPFLVPEVVIQQGSDSINYKLILKDLVITGFDSYEFDKFDFDVKNLQFESSLKMGDVSIKGRFSINGKVLTIPLEGHGTMFCNVSSTSGTLKQDARLIKKKGITYLDLDSPIISIQVGNITDYHYDDIFDGNEIMAKAARKIFQDYQEEISEEVKPTIEKVISEIIYDIEKKSLSKIPFDELYPSHN